MIALQRINGADFVLNAEFIETIESTPDTLIALTQGKKIMVKNSVEDVVKKTIKYKQLCNQTISVITRTEEKKQ